MALKTKSIIGNGARGHHRFTLTVNEESTNVSTNSSNMSFTFQISPIQTSWNWYTWGNRITYSININGTTYSGSIPDYDGYSTVTLKSGSLDIEHTTDGSKTISLSFSVSDTTGQTYTCGNASGSDTLALTSIPRKANILTAPDFNDEQNPTITYENKAGNSVTSLQACISLTGASDDVPYRDISKTGTSYTFNLTTAERNTLRNATTGSNSRNVTFFVKTILGGVTYHSTLTKTLTIVNGNPTFTSSNVSYQDTNSSVVAITTNNQHIVQNKSSLRVSYTSATAKKGASISSYSFVLNGVTRTSSSSSGSVSFGAVNSANNLTLTATVTDSRGNTTSVTKTITMLAYSTPTAIVTLNRLNNYEDTTYLTVDGSVASVNSKNTMAIKYRYKQSGGSYNSFTNISDNVRQTLSLSKNNEYIFNVVVTDAFNETYNQEFVLGKGVFPLFIDTEKNSVGINGFPTHNEAFEVTGNFYLNNKIINDSGWITLNTEIKYRRKYGYVTIVGQSSGTKTLTQNSYTTIGTMPVNYRPSITIPFTYHCTGGTTGSISAYISDAGNIQLYTTESGKNYWMFSVTYPV